MIEPRMIENMSARTPYGTWVLLKILIIGCHCYESITKTEPAKVRFFNQKGTRYDNTWQLPGIEKKA